MRDLDKCYTTGYIQIMKTAISIDKSVFDAAETFSRNTGLSRSRLYNIAINEYIQNHEPDIITKKLDDYYGSHPSRLDDELQDSLSVLFSKERW